MHNIPYFKRDQQFLQLLMLTCSPKTDDVPPITVPVVELELLTNRGIGLSYPYTTRGNGKSQEEAILSKKKSFRYA